jgi:hypothetical protein
MRIHASSVEGTTYLPPLLPSGWFARRSEGVYVLHCFQKKKLQTSQPGFGEGSHVGDSLGAQQRLDRTARFRTQTGEFIRR